jgi:hypothetical protein
MPTPTPTPTPTPPPPPVSPAIFSSVTTNTDFAVLGLEASDQNIPASSLERNGFSVRYDAASHNYIIDFPKSSAPGQFTSYNEDLSFWFGSITGSDNFVDIFKPRSTNPEISLSYTSFGVTTGYYASDFGFFAFGIPTAPAGVPVTGSATYDAKIVGRPLDHFGHIEGDATFQFNFGAGTLSGRMDPILLDSVSTPLGTYTFVNTVFGVGSPTFSGSLSRSGAPAMGGFDGRFTGPAAQELMARWTAPYLNPSTQQWKEMFGVMVGKKP